MSHYRSLRATNRPWSKDYVVRWNLRHAPRGRKVLASLNHPNIAQIYGLDLGEADHVFEWLDRSYDDASIWLTFLVKCDPRLNPFRSDPRFRDLLRRMGLEG